jgi:hypothetical protein
MGEPAALHTQNSSKHSRQGSIQNSAHPATAYLKLQFAMQLCLVDNAHSVLQHAFTTQHHHSMTLGRSCGAAALRCRPFGQQLLMHV